MSFEKQYLKYYLRFNFKKNTEAKEIISSVLGENAVSYSMCSNSFEREILILRIVNVLVNQKKSRRGVREHFGREFLLNLIGTCMFLKYSKTLPIV